jgi:hypothetical protein
VNLVVVAFVRKSPRLYIYICAGIFKACFGLENGHFHENSPKTLVFVPIGNHRQTHKLVLEEINLEARI